MTDHESQKERAAELARMLSGSQITDAVLKHAAAMLAPAGHGARAGPLWGQTNGARMSFRIRQIRTPALYPIADSKVPGRRLATDRGAEGAGRHDEWESEQLG